MKQKITSTEKQIIARLDVDSRIPLSKLGKEIRQSQQRVSYTVKSLMEKGIIKSLYTLIDYSKFGVLLFRAYFRIGFTGEKKTEELLNYLISEPHTGFIAACGGRHDLICTFFAENPSKFNKLLRSIMEKFPHELQNYTVLTTVVRREFGRKYLSRERYPLEQIFVGGDRKPGKIDELDMKILSEIAEDARKSSVAISENLSITSKTVIERIKKLREREIILGFKMALNSRNMGYRASVIFIRYHNISGETEEGLINYLRTHPNITGIVKTIGEWDIEIEVEAEDTIKIRKIEMEIRQKFASLIKEIESVPIYQIHKRSYMPKFLILKES